jgi:hypothetical protein
MSRPGGDVNGRWHKMDAFRARILLILLSVSAVIACDSPTKPNTPSPSSALVLPVTGTWHVLKGPPCPNVNNHHCNVPNQQFALDLIALDPVTLAAVSCFGMPILSPSKGEVVAAVDGLPDLPIGQTDPSNPAGNHVVIRRSDAEYLSWRTWRRGVSRWRLAQWSPPGRNWGHAATVAIRQVLICTCTCRQRPWAPNLPQPCQWCLVRCLPATPPLRNAQAAPTPSWGWGRLFVDRRATDQRRAKSEQPHAALAALNPECQGRAAGRLPEQSAAPMGRSRTSIELTIATWRSPHFSRISAAASAVF